MVEVTGLEALPQNANLLFKPFIATLAPRAHIPSQSPTQPQR